jgi:hypothetical protein
LAAWRPLAAHAQQPKVPVVGFLSSRSPGESAGVVAAFRQGLRETGFVEGRNLAIAFRWADGRYDSLPALAAELVDLPATLIFAAGGPPTALAAARALGIELKVLNASSEDELETAFAAVAICVLARSLSPANHFSTASAKGS